MFLLQLVKIIFQFDYMDCWNLSFVEYSISDQFYSFIFCIFQQSKLLEDYYRGQRKLMNFNVSGGPGETWKGLLAALQLQHIDTSNSPQKLTV